MPKYLRDVITYPKLILCEGRADEAFLRAFLLHRQLGNATIRNTSDADPDGEGAGSVSLFGELLLASTTWTNFEMVTDILVVCDSDDDPAINLASIQHQIITIGSSTNPVGLFPVPAAYEVPTTGNPTLRVLSIPWHDRAGNMEVLCYPAALSVSQHAAHVEAFGQATAAINWPRPNSVGKFYMRAILAVGNRADPALGIGKLWSRANKDEFVPLGHASLDQLAGALGAFLS